MPLIYNLNESGPIQTEVVMSAKKTFKNNLNIDNDLNKQNPKSSSSVWLHQSDYI